MTAEAADGVWCGGLNPLELTELEVASGVALGSVHYPAWADDEKAPLDALFDELRTILQRGKCVVLAFSGGRDSSFDAATPAASPVGMASTTR